MHRGKWTRLSLSISLLIAVWALTSGTFFEAEIVPSPVSVIAKLLKMVENAQIFVHLGASFRR
ncbi:MAG: hypothetical protein QF593_00905, partial [Nitrospinota bacterium]|nr:hypothetical protein [Nitrospinota bacterium]